MLEWPEYALSACFTYVCSLLQRLIPVDSGSDLFVYKAPELPQHKLYTIRPYLPEDEMAVYTVCRKTCLDGLDGTEIFSEYPNLAPERYDSGYPVSVYGTRV